MKRQYKPRFDWDEARRLYEQEIPMTWIAAKLKVSPSAIARVVQPGRMEQMERYSRERNIGTGVCPKCGGPMNLQSVRNGARSCVPCSNKARTTSVREHELRCAKCKQWKPDDQFYRNAAKPLAHRRHRHALCKNCSDANRKKYRISHRTPCKGGCGRLVSVSDQASAKRTKDLKITPGYCPYCSPTSPWPKKKYEHSIKRGAEKFREKFGAQADETGTTEH